MHRRSPSWKDPVDIRAGFDAGDGRGEGPGGDGGRPEAQFEEVAPPWSLRQVQGVERTVPDVTSWVGRREGSRGGSDLHRGTRGPGDGQVVVVDPEGQVTLTKEFVLQNRPPGHPGGVKRGSRVAPTVSQHPFTTGSSPGAPRGPSGKTPTYTQFAKSAHTPRHCGRSCVDLNTPKNQRKTTITLARRNVFTRTYPR